MANPRIVLSNSSSNPRLVFPNFHITQTGSGRLGNIGEPLEHGQVDNYVDDDEEEGPGGDIQPTDAQDGGLDNYELRQVNSDFVEGSYGTPWDVIEEVRKARSSMLG